MARKGSADKKSLGKTVLVIFLVLAVIVVIVVAYNEYSRFSGGPGLGDALRNATALIGENALLREQLANETAAREAAEQDLEALGGGLPGVFYLISGVIVLFALLLAYSLRSNKDGVNRSREELFSRAKQLVFEHYGLLGGSESVGHPDHLVYERVVDDTFVLSRVDGVYYALFGFVRRSVFGLDRVNSDYCVTVGVRSNNLDDVLLRPGLTPLMVRESLVKELRSMEGDGELARELSELVRQSVTKRLVDDEVRVV